MAEEQTFRGDAKEDQGILPADATPGGTLAGEDVNGGSVLKPEGERPDRSEVTGYFTGTVRVDPAMAGTVAGDTEAAEKFLTWDEDQAAAERIEAEEDAGYGPDGSTIQEIGGMGRAG